MRAPLGLWYGALTGLVVVLVTLLTYALHTRGHYDDVDHVLVTMTQHVADELEAAMPMSMPGMPMAPPLDPHPDPLASPTAAGLVLRVYDPAGLLLEASPNASIAPSIPPADVLAQPGRPPYDPVVVLAPSFTALDASPGALGIATDRAGVRWRLYALPLRNSRSLIASLPLDRVDASVAWFRTLVPRARRRPSGFGRFFSQPSGLLQGTFSGQADAVGTKEPNYESHEKCPRRVLDRWRPGARPRSHSRPRPVFGRHAHALGAARRWRPRPDR